MPTIVQWNGRAIPEEMKSLPSGRYVVESVDEVPRLTAEEETGLEAAMASIDRGEGVENDEVRRRLNAALHS